MLELILRLQSRKLDEHLKYWFPFVYKMLLRFKIFFCTNSNLNLVFWLFWIVTGKHIVLNNYVLSNYGVWIARRPNDATFNFAIDASYLNNLERILRSVNRKTIFFDVGANIGVFSIIAAKNRNISAIHAFEPDDASFAYLKLNAIRNKSINIFAHHFAIGKEEGPAFLSKTEGHSGLSKIIAGVSENNKTYSEINMVNQIFLNSILINNQDELFVKIDVEGSELDVLETLEKSTFFVRINSFFIEFDRSFGKVESVENFLIRNGFSESGRWGTDSHWDGLWLKP